MTTIIDQEIWDKIVSPISEQSPAGIDTRSDISPSSTYQIIREARAVARNNERSNLAIGETNYFALSDWAIILDHAPKLLAEQSKDLEIAAWYIEALVRHYGFAGLCIGFKLACELIEKFGKDCYPEIDEDGISSQLASLSGLNGYGAEGTLIGPIKSILVTQGDAPGPLATWQCEQSFEISRINDVDRREARLRQGGISKEQLDKVIKETPNSYFDNLNTAIEQAVAAYDAFQQTLDQYAQEDPQPTGNIKTALEECKQNLIYIAGDRLKSLSTVEETSDDETVVISDSEAQPAASISTRINSRSQAISQLQLVADYFKAAEPHSPIPYSIEQIIRWSSLDLIDLIQELIPDDTARTKFKKLSGIPES